MTWSFVRLTGQVWYNGKLIGTGYSGHGEGLNNPTDENIPDLGPIPHGNWTIGTFFDHPHLGPCVAHLTPTENCNTFGRSAFFIHGDNAELNHTASDGCIILDKQIREEIRDSKDTDLLVT